MVRRSPYYRESCGEIHAVLEVERLERGKSLVVVHCQSRIELAVVREAEKSVRRVRSECHDAFVVGCLDCRCDDGLFLVAEKPVVAAMRIKSENCNLRICNAEITFQRRVHETEFRKDFLGGDAGRNLFKRNVSCDYTDLQLAADHEHSHVFHAEFLFQILCVACKSEAGIGHRPLVDRASHQNVDVSAFKVSHGSFQCRDGGFR